MRTCCCEWLSKKQQHNHPVLRDPGGGGMLRKKHCLVRKLFGATETCLEGMSVILLVLTTTSLTDNRDPLGHLTYVAIKSLVVGA